MRRMRSTIEDPVFTGLNMTPLIDVLLVLLIMFIISIPLQTHSVKIDLPGAPPPDSKALLLLKNKVAITERDELLWNGAPVGLPELRLLFAQSQQLSPLPELHIEPASGARFETVDIVLATAKREQVQRLGFVGNERFADF